MSVLDLSCVFLQQVKKGTFLCKKHDIEKYSLGSIICRKMLTKNPAGILFKQLTKPYMSCK